jgi:hypothetical protein
MDLGEIASDSHEHKPWLDACAAFIRAHEPLQLRRVKLDQREVAGLEVGGAGTRLPADDLAGVDLDDVARPVEAQRLRHGLAVRGALLHG